MRDVATGLFLSEESIQAAADYMIDNAELAAAAKAELVLAKEDKQTTYDRAFMIGEGSIKYREAYAQCSDPHQAAIIRVAAAEKAVEFHRRKHSSCVAIIEFARSQMAYMRDLGKLR